ncbi:uncharacterized protein LOC105387562 [Plutella xylostella]|uniref:uncharacterized protein LOC105387562 n=1 Tax=Plutella xylostella TaxID=51655 RepID=UPI002032C6F0|nr:uncharacterized protein LOC105387562 [Plutella xylostella]
MSLVYTSNVVEIIKDNFRAQYWQVIILVGKYPNGFYSNLKTLGTIVTINNDGGDHEVEDVVLFQPNTIVIQCSDVTSFDVALKKTLRNPYWHPHANIIIYHQGDLEKSEIARIFFILWYHRVPNAIILQYDESQSTFLISKFTPYNYENYRMSNEYGCWTTKQLGLPIVDLKKFVCVSGCHNVTIESPLRYNNFGTCIGYNTYSVGSGDIQALRAIDVFEDKGSNLHGFPLRAFISVVPPFVEMTRNANGSLTFGKRDGKIWSTMARLLNFTIDFTPSRATLTHTFEFSFITQQLLNFSQRKFELILFPIYVMDTVIIEADLTHPFKHSGLCFMSRRADFETLLFDAKLFLDNLGIFLEYSACFLALWLGFHLFSVAEGRGPSLDQAGKDLMNTIRTVLSTTLYKPSRKRAIRILLFVAIWGFFIVNFVTQAAIISFFTTFKRGKDLETFEDILQTGYNIEGLASPDVVLPDDEERFVKINAKFVPIKNTLDCLRKLDNESHRFCLNECSCARYFERNLLNARGQQFLHVLSDVVHSRHLAMMLPKHSAMTRHYNRHMARIVEAGLVAKWEDYRYNDIKEEAPIKPLSFEDLVGIFKCYLCMVALSFVAFLVEIGLGVGRWCKKKTGALYKKWKHTRDKKQGNIKCVNAATQTKPFRIF